MSLPDVDESEATDETGPSRWGRLLLHPLGALGGAVADVVVVELVLEVES